MEAPPGFEPGHEGFADLGLTAWLWRHILFDKNAAHTIYMPTLVFLYPPAKSEGIFITCGAEDGIRTRDFDLGKVALYH